MARLITLTTDFGTRDPFVGVMKGVILSINPQARIVDLTHEIEPQGVEQAAFLLYYTSFRFFPPDTVHLVVVDPGVGGGRRALAARGGRSYFVAPDNGILSFVAAKEGFLEVVQLTNPDFWLAPVSDTFHGRDVFAPVAAHLSLGVELSRLGRPLKEPLLFPAIWPRWEGTRLVGRVMHIDRFGNLVTDIPGQALGSGECRIHLAGKAFCRLGRTYSEVAKGELLGYIGSFGFLEVAVRERNAARALGIGLGAPVVVERAAAAEGQKEA